MQIIVIQEIFFSQFSYCFCHRNSITKKAYGGSENIISLGRPERYTNNALL